MVSAHTNRHILGFQEKNTGAPIKKIFPGINYNRHISIISAFFGGKNINRYKNKSVKYLSCRERRLDEN